MRPGSGRLQRAILAQLDGVPVDLAGLVDALAGPTPSHARYSAVHGAVHALARGGFVELSYRRHSGSRTGYVLAVVKMEPPPVHVRSRDRGIGSDGEVPPVPPVPPIPAVERYASLTDAAWAAFGTDPAYAIEIAKAAVKLIEHTGEVLGVHARDGDQGNGDDDPGPGRLEYARVRVPIAEAFYPRTEPVSASPSLSRI